MFTCMIKYINLSNHSILFKNEKKNNISPSQRLSWRLDHKLMRNLCILRAHSAFNNIVVDKEIVEKVTTTFHENSCILGGTYLILIVRKDLENEDPSRNGMSVSCISTYKILVINSRCCYKKKL